ncbi:MAG TPA: ABC transporter permease [Chitinophagales bacterium]|nr:ABC transporter permease [Chitinophagales bacterium]
MPSSPVLIINSKPKPFTRYLLDTYAYKALITALTYRDVKVKYAQTLLGLMWVFAQPLIQLVIYTLFFGHILNITTGNIPYVLFAFSGIICWQLFTALVQESSAALLKSAELVKKIYFPKLIIPLSKGLLVFWEFTAALFMLGLTIVYFKIPVGLPILLLPVFVLLTIAAGLGIGLWLCVISAYKRDLLHIIPLVLNMGMWLTPVFYPVSILPDGFKWLLYGNPLSGILAGFRWALFNDPPPSVYYLFSFMFIVLLFVSGLYYFCKRESAIVDTM